MRLLFSFLTVILNSLFLGAVDFPIAPYQPSGDNNKQVVGHKKWTEANFSSGLFLCSSLEKKTYACGELVQVKWNLMYPNAVGLNIDYKITNYQIPLLPDLVKDGSIIPEIDDPESVQSIVYNGIPYRAKTLLCFYMSSLNEGVFSVGEGKVNIQLTDDKGNPLGNQIQLVSPTVTFKVEELKNKPQGFSGGIGTFSMDVAIDNMDDVHLGQSVTLSLFVNGSGNLKYIGQPNLAPPDSVDIYEAKPTSEIRYTLGGCTGKRQFSYVLIPRKKGRINIPYCTFSYFDVKTKTFKNLHSKPFTIDVLPSKETDRVDSDLQSKVNEEGVGENNSPFLKWGGISALLLLISLLLYLIFSHKNRKKEEQPDLEALAVAQLTEAFDNNNSDYCNLAIHILINFIENKLNVPISTQSKNMLASILSDNGICEATVSELVSTISECERESFSRETSSVSLASTHQRVVGLIHTLDREFVNCVH